MGYGVVKLDKSHPETQLGEVFYCNADLNIGSLGFNQFKSLRFGETAYDIYEKIVPHLKPVFIQEEEYKNHLTRKGMSFGYALDLGVVPGREEG